MCEEGDCAQEQFTAVFRSDIDLKAHQANIHSKSLGKMATKQLKTLEFEFTLAPRRNAQGDNGRGSSSHQHHRHRVGYDNQAEFEHEPIPYPIQVPSRVIDSNNEQEFPSLGGNGGGAIRPNVSISAKSFGSAGLVKTKENFPSLGGDGFSDPVSSKNGQFGQSSASAMLRKTNNGSNGPLKPAGMVIHVSNRPTSVKRPVEIQQKSKKDFPSLPGNFNDPDPLPPVNHNFNMNAVASRHRSLVDDYVSVNNNGGAKLTMLQTKETTQKSEIKAPPKIASENNFPSLSGPSANSKSSALWTLTKSSQPIKTSQTTTQIKESKSKAKIKKEPEEQITVRKNSSSKITLQSTKENNVKKPTTKTISENNFPSLSVNSSTTSLATQWANTRPAQPTFVKSIKQPIVNKTTTTTPKETKKSKIKQFEDEDEPETNPSFDMSAFSAKHRILADDYVSINPNVGNKLTMVQQKSSGQKSENRSAPKIESENNFPSLGGPASSNLAAQWNVPKLNPPKVESRKLKVAPAPDLSSSKKQETTNLKDKKKPLEKRDQNNKSVKDKKVDNLNNINNNSNSISNNNNWSETAKKEPEVIAKVEPKIKVENIELRSDEKFPALGKQPPGFENSNKFKPPPGFNVTLNSVARAPSSSLTFTSSLGESYSILPTHHYLPPPSALKRNQVCFFFFFIFNCQNGMFGVFVLKILLSEHSIGKKTIKF